MAVTILKKRHKRVYKMEDLTRTDIQLLAQAASAEQDVLFCFGMSGYKLLALGLIDEESKVTTDGIQAIRSFQ